MLEACNGGAESSLQVSTNLDHDRQIHDTPVIKFMFYDEGSSVWVLLEHSLVFHDLRTLLENNRKRERERKHVSNFCYWENMMA